jgi:proline-specific peptidase
VTFVKYFLLNDAEIVKREEHFDDKALFAVWSFYHFSTTSDILGVGVIKRRRGWRKVPFVEVEKGRLYYEINGEGRWLVLIHGAWASHEWWRWQVPELSHNYRVLSLDVRGHGQSSPLEEPDSVDNFAKDLETLLQKVGAAEVALVGWSMGGIISMQYYLDNPSRVKTLVLVATRGHRNPKMKLQLWLQQLQTRLSLMMDFADYEAVIYQDQVEKEVRSMLSPATPKEVIDWIMTDLTNNPRRNFFEVAKSLWNWEAGDRLAAINVPTLIMVGEEDNRTPPHFSRLLHEKIPNSKLVVVENCGHYLLMERPDIVNAEIIRFLKNAGY